MKTKQHYLNQYDPSTDLYPEFKQTESWTETLFTGLCLLLLALVVTGIFALFTFNPKILP